MRAEVVVFRTSAGIAKAEKTQSNLRPLVQCSSGGALPVTKPCNVHLIVLAAKSEDCIHVPQCLK